MNINKIAIKNAYQNAVANGDEAEMNRIVRFVTTDMGQHYDRLAARYAMVIRILESCGTRLMGLKDESEFRQKAISEGIVKSLEEICRIIPVGESEFLFEAKCLVRLHQFDKALDLIHAAHVEFSSLPETCQGVSIKLSEYVEKVF